MTAVAALMRQPYGWLRRWLFDPAPVHALVICRIGFGSVLFLAYLSRWSIVDVIYGPKGYAGHGYFERYAEGGPVSWPLAERFDYLQRVSSGETIWALYLLLLVSSLSFALGVWPRLTGTIALALHISFHGRNPAATWGWATMIKPFLLYAVLAPTGRYWSIVDWIRRCRGAVIPPVAWRAPAWPLRLLQVHVACSFLALWTRVDEESWLAGQTLALAVTNRNWGRFDIDWYPYFGILEIFCLVALVLELGGAFMLFIKPVGKYWTLGLMGLFAALILTTSVGWWDFVMLFALTAFLPEGWLRWVIGPDVPWLRARGPTRAESTR